MQAIILVAAIAVGLTTQYFLPFILVGIGMLVIYSWITT